MRTEILLALNLPTVERRELVRVTNKLGVTSTSWDVQVVVHRCHSSIQQSGGSHFGRRKTTIREVLPKISPCGRSRTTHITVGLQWQPSLQCRWARCHSQEELELVRALDIVPRITSPWSWTSFTKLWTPNLARQICHLRPSRHLTQ